MSSEARALSYCGCVLLGGLITLFVCFKLIIPSHDGNSKRIVATLMQDLSQSERNGAISILDQCNKQGYAFVSNHNSTNQGLFMNCEDSEVSTVGQEELSQLAGKFQKYNVGN